MHKNAIHKTFLLSLGAGLLLALSVQSANASDIHIGVYLPTPHVRPYYQPKHYNHDHYVNRYDRYDRHHHDHRHHHNKHKKSHHHHSFKHGNRHHH